MLIPRLDAKEVAAVFSAPLHNFLRGGEENPVPSSELVKEGRAMRQAAGYGDELVEDDGKWYEGMWIPWHNSRFKMHNFYVPVQGQNITYPRSGPLKYQSQSTDEGENPLRKLSRFRVWGMTARILVDCARVAYHEKPDFEVNDHLGDEQLIGRLLLKWEGQLRKTQREAEDESSHKKSHLENTRKTSSRNGRL